MNSWKMIRPLSWAEWGDSHTFQNYIHSFSDRGELKVGSLYIVGVTVEDKDVFCVWVGNELHDGSTVIEYPADWPIGHFLSKFLFKSCDRLHQFWRHAIFATFWVVDLPAAWSYHHNFKSEPKMIFEHELGIPQLWIFLILDHVANLGGGINSCFILNNKICFTLSMLMSANSAS